MKDDEAPDADPEQQRDQAIRHSYEATVHWSRRCLTAFFTVAVFAVVWGLPWQPFDSGRFAYNDRVLFQTVLSGAAALFAFGAVALRDRQRHAESTLVAWSAIHDRLTGLRQREFFFDRLSFECERCRGADRRPAVIVLKLVPADGSQLDLRRVERAMLALQPLVQSADDLALISAREIGVIVPETFEEEVPEKAAWLTRAVTDSTVASETHFTVETGWAVLSGGRDPGDLVGQARAAVAERAAKPSVAA